MTVQTLVFMRQVGPPLLLLPLFVASLDVTWLVAWMLGGMAALISVITLGSLLIATGRKERAFSFKRETMTRPLLTVLIVSAAWGVASLTEANADRYGTQLIATLQHACKQQGQCPVMPEGWRQHGKYAQGKHGHWVFTYVTNPARSEFGLVIHKNWETERCVYGGNSIELIELGSVHCLSDPQLPRGFQALIEASAEDQKIVHQGS